MLPGLILAGVLLLLVLIPPFGQAINGTRRWIRLGPVSFQPAELAKLALVIYLAAFVARRGDETTDVRHAAAAAARGRRRSPRWCSVQPDLGNCLTLVALTFGVLYMAGTPVKLPGRDRGSRAAAARAGDLGGALSPAADHRVLGPVVGSGAAAASRSSSRGWPSATAA